jgi:hypothetical protein
MNYGEFVSDRFASVQYQHHFEGFLLNRIPLMKKLKWRLVGTANVLYGGLSDQNRDLISETDLSGETTLPVGNLQSNRPYVELGYGVENIFKFLRIDFVHRLSYLDYQDSNGVPVDVRKFAVLFSVQFAL